MSETPRDLRAICEAVYSEPSPAHEAVRRDAHLPGDELGQCGYTLPAQLDRLAEALSLGPGTRLLDIGCGRGGPTLYLARRTGCRAIGTDFARSGMARAKGHGVAFVVADAAALPLANGCMDAIVSLDVFIFLPDREAALRECRRVLRPGGRLAIVDQVERGPGLSPTEREARALFGPVAYDTEASHLARLQAAGFVESAVEDWTPEFIALNERWVASRERHRVALIAEGSEAGYEASHGHFVTNRDTARDGRLARVRIVAQRP